MTTEQPVFRKGPAYLHVYGKPYEDRFRVSHLPAECATSFRNMHSGVTGEFTDEHFYEWAMADILKRSDIKIGDVAWIAPYNYGSRPGYGFHIVTWDPDANRKTISNNEGMPRVPYQDQLDKIRENEVTYDHLLYAEILDIGEYDSYGWVGFEFSYIENGINSPGFKAR